MADDATAPAAEETAVLYVRMPATMKAALHAEAQRREISDNQLAVEWLGYSLEYLLDQGVGANGQATGQNQQV